MGTNSIQKGKDAKTEKPCKAYNPAKNNRG
jgi:hypothetical protein